MTRLSQVIKETPPELIGNVQSFEAGWMAACRFMEMNMGRVTYKMGHRMPRQLKAPVVFNKKGKP